jgi:hypothetical protein
MHLVHVTHYFKVLFSFRLWPSLAETCKGFIFRNTVAFEGDVVLILLVLQNEKACHKNFATYQDSQCRLYNKVFEATVLTAGD